MLVSQNLVVGDPATEAESWLTEVFRASELSYTHETIDLDPPKYIRHVAVLSGDIRGLALSQVKVIGTGNLNDI